MPDSEREAKLLYSHDIINREPAIYHTIYSGETWALPTELTPESLPKYFDVICQACPALWDVLSATRGMRPATAGEPAVDARCSLQTQTAVVVTEFPRYVNLNARCRLIDEGRLVKTK